MTGEVRYINDVKDIYDTWLGYMGDDEPTEREMEEQDYLLIGVAESQDYAESICEKLNEQNEELIEYCNFSLHDLLDKKNKEIEQLKSDNNRLVKQTAEKVAEHQQRVLNLIDEQIIGLEKYDEICDDDWYIGQIDVLKNLKKELSE